MGLKKLDGFPVSIYCARKFTRQICQKVFLCMHEYVCAFRHYYAHMTLSKVRSKDA